MKGFSAHTMAAVASAGEQALRVVLESKPTFRDGTPCTGFHLEIAYVNDPEFTLFKAAFGELDYPRRQTAKFAHEKVVRVCKMFKIRGDILSWESRDDENEMYQGAIIIVRTEFGILAVGVSGFPAPVDEATAMVIAMDAFHVPFETLNAKASVSGNQELLRQMADIFYSEI